MRHATDIGGGDNVRASRFQRLDLVGQQLCRQVRLQQRIGAGRSAAQMPVWHHRQLKPGVTQQAFDHTANLQTMLQTAGRVESDLLPGHFRIDRIDVRS